MDGSLHVLRGIEQVRPLGTVIYVIELKVADLVPAFTTR